MGEGYEDNVRLIQNVLWSTFIGVDCDRPPDKLLSVMYCQRNKSTPPSFTLYIDILHAKARTRTRASGKIRFHIPLQLRGLIVHAIKSLYCCNIHERAARWDVAGPFGIAIGANLQRKRSSSTVVSNWYLEQLEVQIGPSNLNVGNTV